MSGHKRGGKFKRNRYGDDKKEPNKLPPNLDLSSPIIQAFLGFRTELDHRHDKHERLVKLSRDITIESKRTIFLLHRVSGNEDTDSVFKEAEAKLAEIDETKWKGVANELKNEDPYQFMRAISPGMQEYIEALSFYHYLKTERIVSIEEVEKRLQFDSQDLEDSIQELKTESEDSKMESSDSDQMVPQSVIIKNKTSGENKIVSVHIPPLEYILGLADLTGELMRMAIHSVGSGNLDVPFKHCALMRTMYDALVSYGNVNRELGRKLHTLKQSLQKVETACYNLQVRGSEIPKHMLADVFSKGTDSDGVMMDADPTVD